MFMSLLLFHRYSLGQNTGVGRLSLLQGIFPTQGSNPGLPHCRQILAEPQEKAKNTGVGSLFLLQVNFTTQELNWGLLYCRQILYQLSYQGSPLVPVLLLILLMGICQYMGININNILKSRDLTLPTKARIVKVMVFPVVMYGCDSWTIKKAEH